MKIIFNLLGTGLGNNGGSKTLIRSAETLLELGEDVSLCCTKNSCTWWPVRVPVIKKLQPCDALIATGYGSVMPTIRYPKARLKLWYVRAHENWVTNDKALLHGYRSLRCIANSEWIVAWLRTRKIHCDLVYPGLDFENYEDYDDLRADVFGGLMHRHARKRSQDCLGVEKISEHRIHMLNRDFQGGDFYKLSRFYNRIKAWLSPSENEGIQNVPMEATLCGCALVLTDHFMGGTVDYAVNEETCLIYPARDLQAAAECVDRIIKDDKLRRKLARNASQVIREKIGTREENMSKLAELLKRMT